MRVMRTVARVIEAISEWTGNKVACWACVVLVIVLFYDTAARHIFNAPTVWAYETAMMLGIAIGSLGMAYTHKHHGHVRIDVLYRLLSPRGKAIVNVVCAPLLFLPLVVIIVITAADWMWLSWSIGERMIKSFWYPPTGPIRTIMFLGFSLFAVQGVAQLIRDLHLVIRKKPL